MENARRKILIIEDDRFISEMYARTLTNDGFEVVETVSGPEGDKLAKEGGWSYILLDIMLPDKTGVEILQGLRPEGYRHGQDETKIIVMTNFEQDDATRQAMEKLADGYLIKAEITPRRLSEIVREMEGQSAASPTSANGETPSAEQPPETPAE